MMHKCQHAVAKLDQLKLVSLLNQHATPCQHAAICCVDKLTMLSAGEVQHDAYDILDYAAVDDTHGTLQICL